MKLTQLRLTVLAGALVGLAAAQGVIAPSASAQEAPPQELQVVHLRHTGAEEAGKLLAQVLRTNENVRIAADARTNSLIISASQDVIQSAQALLEAIDTPAADSGKTEASVPPFRVRVIWLANGLGHVGVVPEDLAPVLKELETIGISHLELAGQMMLNVGQAGHPFSIRCTPELDGTKYELTFDGQVEARPGKSPMMYEAGITCRKRVPAKSDAADGGGDELAKIDTAIEAPLDGQYIVLGTTLTGRSTSVFVVQFTEQ